VPSSSPTSDPLGYEPPAPDVYELTWMSGHVEQVVAHDVHFANGRILFLADANGRMRVQLSALEEDLRTIRSITEGEALPLNGGEPA
jgi:hypothetical protein